MINRNEVPIEQTWDLSLLFQTEEEYEQTCQQFKDSVAQFKHTYEGHLSSVEVVVEALRQYRSLLEISSRLGAYASLAVSANTLDKVAQSRYASMRSLLATISSQLSFFDVELGQLPLELLHQVADFPENKGTIEKIIVRKPHLLSKETEEVLAALANTIEFPYQSYNDTKFKDIRFPSFEANGTTYDMTYNSFEDILESDTNENVRKTAFRVFSDTLKRYEHTAASTYQAHVQTDKTLATLRGYDSVFDYLLDRQNVSIDLYHRQLDVIMKELAPHMRRYARLIKRLYHLDTLSYEDLKLDIDPEYTAFISYEEAKQFILEGLQPLGKDYLSIMNQAFDERWIDYAQTNGKRTGAFCASPYGANSFILMFFADSMTDVMTLAHELGHAGHFQLAYQHQNISDGRCSMYFVEAPSTTNELLVEQHLLDKAKDDKRMKRWILSKIVGKTYYHNFVTHFIEAYYQREVYRLIDQGKHVDADTLNTIFKQTLQQFWGEEVVLTPGSELTWMRQPHYFMGLYSYTYSAGLTIGTQVANRMREQGESYAAQWINVLKMGGSKSALELAQAAGVDISTDEPLKQTIAYIGSLIEELEQLSNELE